MTQEAEFPRRPPGADQLVHSDGEPMESWRHVQQMIVLIQSLDYAWRDRNDFFVSGNMFLYFSETQTRKNDFRGPDVFVVMNTPRRERKSWVVWEEGGRTPDVVIELLSKSTEHVDRGEKMRIYARVLHVAEYFLFDPFTGVLEGYDLDSLHAEYRPKQHDDQGRLQSVRLGLLLAPVPCTVANVEARWLRWLRPDGSVLELPVETADAETRRADAATQRAEAATQRAEAETQRAHAEAERARKLEAELEALKRR